jgi:hypothetical protein
LSTPCMNGGECALVGGNQFQAPTGWRCDCAPGYTGPDCSNGTIINLLFSLKYYNPTGNFSGCFVWRWTVLEWCSLCSDRWQIYMHLSVMVHWAVLWNQWVPSFWSWHLYNEGSANFIAGQSYKGLCTIT